MPQPSPFFPRTTTTTATTSTAPPNMLKRASNQQECQVNAAWSSDHRESTTSEQQKKARSDSRLETNLHDMGDLLSSLHTQAFCGQLDPTSFDHSLKYDEWMENQERFLVDLAIQPSHQVTRTILVGRDHGNKYRWHPKIIDLPVQSSAGGQEDSVPVQR
jgi:hypothetical protein